MSQSLHDTGFAVIVNHPIPVDLVLAVYREWEDFFESDAKHNYRYSIDGQDGYFAAPDLAINRDAAPARDNKEFFHVFPWGQYPAEVSDAAARYRLIAMELAATLLTWVEENTPRNVSTNFSMPLSSMLSGGEKNTLLRILRYPPVTGTEAAVWLRAGEHRDTNLLTLLASATEPGLQVRVADSQWLDVPWDVGSVTVNAGVMLELVSDGYYPSATHRVAVPREADQAARPRMAMPLFLHPADHVVLDGARTAAQFLRQRVQASYAPVSPGSVSKPVT